MLPLIIAVFASLALCLAICTLIFNKKLVAAVSGIGASILAGVSIYLMHQTLIERGQPTSPLGAVFGKWGGAHLIVPVTYCVLIFAGIAIAVVSVTRGGKPEADSAETHSGEEREQP